MASFQVKIVWKKIKKRETKIIVPFYYVPPPMCNRKFHKNSNKFKKIKETWDNASFQAKMGGERMRNRENKNYRFVSFLPDG